MKEIRDLIKKAEGVELSKQEEIKERLNFSYSYFFRGYYHKFIIYLFFEFFKCINQNWENFLQISVMIPQKNYFYRTHYEQKPILQNHYLL